MFSVSSVEATDCTDKLHMAVSNEKLLTYSEDLMSRSTNRSVHDCEAPAQWMAETARSLSATHRGSSGSFSFDGCEASEWLDFSILAFCPSPDVTRQSDLYQCTSSIRIAHLTCADSLSLDSIHPSLSVDWCNREGHCARLLRLPDIPSGHVVSSSLVCALSDLRLICVTAFTAKVKQYSEYHPSW